MRRLIILLACLCVLAPMPLAAQVQFSQTAGPGVNQTWSFAKGKGNVLLVATSKKIFRSTDHGSNWSPSVQQFDINTKGILAFDTAGTKAYVMDASGLSASTDQGATWSPVGSLGGGNLFGIAVDRADHVFVGSYSSGVYVSTDAGVTWNAHSDGLPRENGVNDLYPIVRLVAAPNGHVFAIAQSGGLARTTDEGNSWSVVGDSVLPQTISGCAVSSSGTVYVTGQTGIFISTDDGSTWTNIANTNGLMSGAAGEVAADDAGKAVILAGERELWRSTDDGASWTAAGRQSSDDHNALCITGADEYFFDGMANNGVFRSSDKAANWAPSSKGIVTAAVPAMATDSTGRVYAVADTSGLFVSNDFGDTWRVLDDTPFVTHNIGSICACPNGDLYLTIYGVGVMQSTDAGSHWTNMVPVMPGTNKAYMLATCCTPNGNVFAGGFNGTVYRTVNGGTSWAIKRNGIPTDTIRILQSNAYGVVFAVCSSGVYSTVNNGDAWQAGTGSPTGVTAFATIDGAAFAANAAGIYASTDSGKTWLAATTKITNGTGLVVAKDNSGVYATTSTDLEYSANGLTWSKQPFPFATAPISMIQDRNYGVIYVATAGSGVYRSPRPSIQDEVQPTASVNVIGTEQNFPNPFSASTTLRYTLSKACLVELSIVDVNGRTISRLVSAKQNAGIYDVRFDASELSLAAGIYRCKLTCDGVTTSTPLVYLGR